MCTRRASLCSYVLFATVNCCCLPFLLLDSHLTKTITYSSLGRLLFHIAMYLHLRASFFLPLFPFPLFFSSVRIRARPGLRQRSESHYFKRLQMQQLKRVRRTVNHIFQDAEEDLTGICNSCNAHARKLKFLFLIKFDQCCSTWHET